MIPHPGKVGERRSAALRRLGQDGRCIRHSQYDACKEIAVPVHAFLIDFQEVPKVTSSGSDKHFELFRAVAADAAINFIGLRRVTLAAAD